MPRIPSETIEQIAAASDIVEIVSSYFPLKRAGSEFRALCPFHQEKTPSFYVSPAKQSYYCFGCRAGGTVFQFVMDYEHVEFVEAARRLAARAGLTIHEEELSPQEEQRQQQRKRLLQLHAEAAGWFHRHLLRTKAAAHARDYLVSRGINIETAKLWRLGYSPAGWQTLVHWALDSGYTQEELLLSGLVKSKDKDTRQALYDRFRDRLIFPICNDIGEVIAFSGRILSNADQSAKYLNSPETSLFVKGTVLFGLEKSKRAIANARSVIILEGQLDLIAAYEAGFQNVVAPQGTALTEKHAALLRRFAEEVILIFDADSAGQRAAERALAILLRAGLQVRIVRLPAGEDPDSLIRKSGPEAFRELVQGAQDFFDFAVDQRHAGSQLASTTSRVAFVRTMANFIGLVPDVVVRDSIISRLAARLSLPRDAIDQMIQSSKRNSFGSGSEVEEPATPVPTLRHEIAFLCRTVLTEPETLRWIRAQPWPEILAEVAGTELLARILASEAEPTTPSSLAGFLGGLEKGEAAVLTQILLEKTTNTDIGRIFWAEFALRELARRRKNLESIRRISDEDAAAATQADQELKEVLDLESRIKDISRLLTRAREPA
jgi:DNA primase